MIKATPEEIVAYARAWIGTPWRHQGRSRTGIDCAGLLVRTAAEFDLPHGDMQGYRRDPGKAFIRHIESHTLPTTQIVHGAIGVFNDSNQPCHTGIFAVEDGQITVIHSEATPARAVHEEGFDDSMPSLKERLVSIRLFQGVSYVL